MDGTHQFNDPWYVAVWPGMGHVAVNAGIYLLAKLHMTAFAEFDTSNFFDVEAIEVKNGLIQNPRRPRNRLFCWIDPAKKHDLIVFLGEAQPPLGKAAFCQELCRHARDLGVDRIFTFAAMATQMHPEHPSRVFVAATDEKRLEDLRKYDLELLEDGNIGGLNGILLGAAMENGLSGACLLGEMPHIFSQLPFPKASLAILEIFTEMTGIDVDLSELSEQAEAIEKQLGDLLSRMEDQIREQAEANEEDGDDEDEEDGEEEEFTPAPEPPAEKKPDPATVQRIEALFGQAATDRSKAFELKRVLDQMGLFAAYEDRFLDLFRKPGSSA